MYHNRRRELTDEETQWLVENFPTTKNDALMEHLGITHSHLHILARALGLRKTPQFMRAAQRNTANKAKEANTRRGYKVQREFMQNLIRTGNLGKRFEKGRDPKAGKTPEEWAEIRRKAAESWKESYYHDRKRVRWGLEPKTKHRIQEPNANRAMAKHRLTKKLGYTFIEKWLFAYGPNTTRSQICERRDFEKYRFRFCHISETDKH